MPLRLAAAAALWVAVLSAPASAQSGSPDTLEGCRAAVAQDPTRGRELAAQWEALGGGPAAQLCAAEALAFLGANVAAAERFMQAGVAGGDLSDTERLNALRLAGDLWLDAGAGDLAQRSFEAALVVTPAARAPRIGLARLAAARGDYETAALQLTTVITGPGGARDPDALALRAAAYRALGRFDAARSDAQTAVDAAPEKALGWFELGAAAEAQGDVEAAREAWIAAVLAEPDSPAAALAENALQRAALGG